MTSIAAILIWNVITAERPPAQLAPGMMQTAQHPPR
jgi:hypothetical protein